MANVNISNPAISSNGGVLTFDVDGGSWSGDVVVNTDLITLEATSDGFISGLPVTRSKSHLIGLRASYDAGVLSIPVLESVFSAETLLNVTVQSGAISDGTDQNNAISQTSMVNSSAEAYTVPIMRFCGAITDSDTLLWDRSVLDSSVYFEADSVLGTGIDRVEFEISDGAVSNTYIAETKVRSSYKGSTLITDALWSKNGGGHGVYKTPFVDMSVYSDGEVTLTITSYPKYGSVNRSEAIKFRNNSALTLTNRITYVDESAPGGGDGSEGSPFNTFQEGLTFVTLNSPNTHVDTVYFKDGRYSIEQIGSPYITTPWWVTSEAHPESSRDNVVFYSTTNQRQTRIRNQRYKGVTFDISDGGVGSFVLFGNNTTIHPPETDPAYIWFDRCRVTHALGRTGQENSSANFISTGFTATSKWFVSGVIEDIFQDGLISNSAQVYARDLILDRVSGDMFKSPSLLFDCYAHDNSVPEGKTQLSVSSGTVQAGQIMRGANSGAEATVTDYKNGFVYIDTSGGASIGDFKQDDNTQDTTTFYEDEIQVAVGTLAFEHADGVQFAVNQGDRNAILANVWFDGADGQILFTQGGTTNRTRNIAYYNILCVHVSANIGSYSRYSDSTGIIHSGLTIANQRFLSGGGGLCVGSFSRYNVVKQNFLDATLSQGLDNTGSVQRVSDVDNPTTLDAQVDDPIFVNGVGANEDYDPAKSNYAPTEVSPLRNRVPSGELFTLFDMFGNIRFNDGTGAAGAIEYSIDAPTGQWISDIPDLNLNVGSEFTYDSAIHTDGGFLEFRHDPSSQALPSGLTVSANGTISGTPTSEETIANIRLEAK